MDRSGAYSADVLCRQLTSRCDQCGNQISAIFLEVFGGTRCWCSCLLPSSLSISCPTVDSVVMDVMQCLPLAVFTVKQVTQQSEYIFQVLALSRGVAQTYEAVEVWVAMRRALKVTMGADTYYDFQPACAVGVMRAVSAPWQGATRRSIGNSLLGVQIPSMPSLLTLCR